MSRTWNYSELKEASKWMKAHGFMTFDEFCDAMNDHESKRKYYWNYLEKLRRSGITNMYGAAAFLEVEFGLDHKEALAVLSDWMENYNSDDYEDLD